MGHMRLRIPQAQTQPAFIGPSTPVKRPLQKKRARKNSGAPVAERPLAPREDVLRILLQRKTAALEVSQPGDRFEDEAERTAEQVMQSPERDAATQPPVISRMPAAEEETSLSRMCADCAEEKEDAVQRTVGAPEAEIADSAAEDIQRLRNSSGEKLPESERAFFERRFGRDFSQVRLHTGDAAERAARAVNARAFTVGRDIVFGKGQFQPGTREGRRLLAHELTHTVQQGAGGKGTGQVQRQAGDSADRQREEFVRRVFSTFSGTINYDEVPTENQDAYIKKVNEIAEVAVAHFDSSRPFIATQAQKACEKKAIEDIVKGLFNDYYNFRQKRVSWDGVRLNKLVRLARLRSQLCGCYALYSSPYCR